MANEQYVFLKSGNVPTRDQWQQAIDHAGFDFILDPKLDPRTNAGFVPCKLNGVETGVEIYFDDSVEFMNDFANIAGDRDCCISFRWGGSMEECACAMIASLALATRFGAVVSYEGEPPQNLNDFRRNTDTILRDATDAQRTDRGRLPFVSPQEGGESFVPPEGSPTTAEEPGSWPLWSILGTLVGGLLLGALGLCYWRHCRTRRCS